MSRSERKNAPCPGPPAPPAAPRRSPRQLATTSTTRTTTADRWLRCFIIRPADGDGDGRWLLLLTAEGPSDSPPARSTTTAAGFSSVLPTAPTSACSALVASGVVELNAALQHHVEAASHQGGRGESRPSGKGVHIITQIKSATLLGEIWYSGVSFEGNGLSRGEVAPR